MLLDLEIRDPAAMAYCREQIAEVAGVPVLDLRDRPAAAEATREAAAETTGRAARSEAASGAGTPQGAARTLAASRARQAPPASEVEVGPAG